MLCSDVSDLIVLKLKCREHLYMEKKIETTHMERERERERENDNYRVIL